MVDKEREFQSDTDERVIPINSYSSDSELETSAPPGEGEAAPAEAGGDRSAELEQLKAKVAELEDQKLRALADMDNYRKRMARQFDEVVRSANDRLLGQLLEVVDNFERALQHAGEAADVEALRKGMELIYSQLMGVLKQYDLEPIEALGKPFDTNFHEALVHVESDAFDDGIVCQEIAKGYRMGDRVLRFAKVAVSKGNGAR